LSIALWSRSHISERSDEYICIEEISKLEENHSIEMIEYSGEEMELLKRNCITSFLECKFEFKDLMERELRDLRLNQMMTFVISNGRFKK
jgi:hypothetical protein